MPTTNITMESISAEKNRIGAQIEKLQANWNELDAAERVMMRFGGRQPANTSKASAMPQKIARGRPRTGTTSTKAKVNANAGTISLNDGIAAICAKYPSGLTAAQIGAHLEREYGLRPRPNHLGAGLKRHLRGGRLQERAGMWYPPGMSIAA